MRILRLHLRDFRNLHETVLEPGSRFNVFHGNNAQGKTNLLEAVYLLATLRSFRKVRNADLVRWGGGIAEVEALVERRGVTRSFQVHVDRGGRIASVDGKKIQKMSEYFGHFNVVLFTPEDVGLTKGEPGPRRRWLDRAVFNAEPGHMELLRDYEHALRSRNALLRGPSGVAAEAVLEAFDVELARLAARVVVRRRRYLAGLEPLFRSSFEAVVGATEAVELRYRSTLEGAAPEPESSVDEAEEPGVVRAASETEDEDRAVATLAIRARERFAATRGTDLARGYTGIGPHMDDLVAALSGHALRRFGSQGQHRAFVLALKLSEIGYLHRSFDFRPILLLDDVSSELDAERGRRFLGLVEDNGGQVFVTTTERRFLPLSGEARTWRIAGGEVVAEEGP